MLKPRFTLIDSALPLFTASILLIGSVLLWPVKFYWPLAVGAMVAAVVANRRGFTFRASVLAAVSGMRTTATVLTILLLVGALIGVWVAAGTVPAMVYYGLGFASPRFLVPTAFVLAAATSMVLGTSIGTLSTLGVAVMGVANGTGVPLPLVAGALVSGAVFGDRSSPLSGSLNLNAAMTGTDLRRAVSVLAPTGGAALLLSLIGYVGLSAGLAATELGADSPLRHAIAANVPISPWLLTPPVIVMGLSLLRVPVKWSLGAGIVAGAVLSLRQGSVLVPLLAALMGQSAHTADAGLDRVMSGGGIVPMFHQFILILVAGAFNGIMEVTGMMSEVIDRLVRRVRRPAALIGTAMLISLSVALIAANQALAIIVPGRMLRPAFSRAGLRTEELSRALADSGTVLAVLVPWNLMAILAAAAVGVPVSAYAPYALFAWILPLISIARDLIRDRRVIETALEAAD